MNVLFSYHTFKMIDGSHKQGIVLFSTLKFELKRLNNVTLDRVKPNFVPIFVLLEQPLCLLIKFASW